MHKVLKPFKTVNRRFKVDDPVAANDIQGDVSFDTWVERGFIDGLKKIKTVMGVEGVVTKRGKLVGESAAAKV